MTRPIKFRQWHEEPGSEAHMDYQIYDVDPSFTDCTYMQFTGLLDKNGREVFEGDVVIYAKKNLPVVVEFVDGAFGFECIGPDHSGRMDVSGVLMRDVEVIGNIYENPDLLNDKGV